MYKPLLVLSVLAFSSQAFAGSRCGGYDLNQDGAFNQADVLTMRSAILHTAEKDFDYNMDKAVNVSDILAYQFDTRLDIREFATDVRACINGDYDFNGDGVTNVLDVIRAKTRADKWEAARCTGATGDLDVNEDGRVNVSDIVSYTSDLDADSDGFALAAAAYITKNYSALDLNHDKRVNVQDLMVLMNNGKRCK